MNLNFTYDLDKEFDNIQRGVGKYNPNHQPKLLIEILEASINVQEKEKVLHFLNLKIKNEHLDTELAAKILQLQWDNIEEEVTKRFDTVFNTRDPFENITAYLTLNSRCAYNTQLQYFFVSIYGAQPIGIVIHVLLHFYTHRFIEPLFVHEDKPSAFGDFKEALTVLINQIFLDLVEGKDEGYQQQHELRN